MKTEASFFIIRKHTKRSLLWRSQFDVLCFGRFCKWRGRFVWIIDEQQSGSDLRVKDYRPDWAQLQHHLCMTRVTGVGWPRLKLQFWLQMNFKSSLNFSSLWQHSTIHSRLCRKVIELKPLSRFCVFMKHIKAIAKALFIRCTDLLNLLAFDKLVERFWIHKKTVCQV
jgi:hypothetical protein